MINTYDNFFLPVGDLEVGRHFYHELLGLPVKFDFPHIGMTAFRVGNEEPAIILKASPQAKPTIWFEVDDVHNTYQTLREKGIVFLSEPFRIKTGWAAEFEDPFGNRLGVTDYLSDDKE